MRNHLQMFVVRALMSQQPHLHVNINIIIWLDVLCIFPSCQLSQHF